MKRQKISSKDRVGKIYGNITIISIAYGEGNTQLVYNCLCICGKEFKAGQRNLFCKKRSIVSCGCMNKPRPKNRQIEPWKRQYNTWINANTFRKKDGTMRKTKLKKRILLECSLSFDDWKNLCVQNCFYCGTEPQAPLISNKKLFRNGIDRIDSNIGYILSNCVPCCKQCNFAKNELTVNEFMQWISIINKYQNKGNV